MRFIITFLQLFFLVVIIVIIYFGIKLYKKASLKKEQILERWETLIEQGSGNGDMIYNLTSEVLEAAEPPGVGWRREKVRAGEGWRGKYYDALVVSNAFLSDFRIYLIAYDYGTSLHVAWFLIIQPSLWKRLISVLFSFFGKETDPRTLALDLNIPQELEVHAYTRTVHSASKKAVDALMTQLKQDFSKVNTKSKGFLELW